MIRHLIVPLTIAVVTVHAGQAFAQGAFPAPLPRPGRTRKQRIAVPAGERRGARGVGGRVLRHSRRRRRPVGGPAAFGRAAAAASRAARRMPA